MRQLTDFGLQVRKALLERGMSVADLAKAIGAKNATSIRDMLYGDFKGLKYQDKIERYLYLGVYEKRNAVSNE